MHRRPQPLVRCAALSVVLLSVWGCGGPAPIGSSPIKGRPIGELPGTGLDGNPIELKQLVAGKVALIDVWATWCAPCVASMPHMQAIYNRYKDRGFTVVGVMIDKNATRIGPEFVQKKGISYPIIMDDDGEKTEQAVGGISGIPLILLVDQQGTVVKVFQGFGNPEILEQAIEQVFKGAAAPAV
jgi:thiol-disulfide isomerase/thioredoxin